MPCGCTENKNLNKDKLSLESMQTLSIDEIINLYRQGYTFEDQGNNQVNIESMTYGTDCTGSVTVDRQLTSTGSLANMTMTDAAAQRFVPISRCLKSVTLRLMRILDNDVYVEIRTDSGGSGALPVGNPQDSSNRVAYATIPYASIPTSFGEVTVPLDILLPNLNPLWIVTCLYAYTSPCNTNPPCGDTSYYVDGGGSGTGTTTEYGARKADVNPWTKFGSLWFKTNKQTYGPPAPTLASISVTPTTASVNVGATTQLTAMCTDTSGTAMTCPTLAWVSSNTAKATVSLLGLVTGVAAGSANITASASGVTSNNSVITVNVSSQVLTTISITPISQSINTGGMVQLTAVCKDAGGATMTCPTLAWTSSDNTKATVSLLGSVTGVAAGSANITASASGVTSNTSVITVTGTVSTLTSIVVSPVSASIGIGGIRQLTAVCKDQNVNAMTCPTLTWVSSNNAKATVNYSGLVTGITEGTANVTTSASGVTSNTSVITVTTAPPPQAGGGGAIVIAAVALVAAAMFMARKPPTSPT